MASKGFLVFLGSKLKYYSWTEKLEEAPFAVFVWKKFVEKHCFLKFKQVFENFGFPATVIENQVETEVWYQNKIFQTSSNLRHSPKPILSSFLQKEG